jgi:hypothetical protein
LTWSTLSSSPIYSCTCRCPQVLATVAGHPASWSLGPSLTSVLHRSQTIGTARLYLTFTSPSTIAFELHTCAPQAKRHVAQPNSRQGWFTNSTQDASHVDNHSSQPNHMGTYQPCVCTYDVLNLPLHSLYNVLNVPLSLWCGWINMWCC